MSVLTVSLVAVVGLVILVLGGFVWWWRLRERVAIAAAKSDLHPSPSLGAQTDTFSVHQERRAAVFASYSRKDAELVRGLLGLFRATDLPVFRDEDSIGPGRKWRIAIDAALDECQTVLVFWCGHAAQSSEVQNEYERAISLDKRVVPVLMDHTVLPSHLGEYQGVDLRGALGESHETLIEVLDGKFRDLTTSAGVLYGGYGLFGAPEAERQLFAAEYEWLTLVSGQLQRALDSIL